MSRDIVPKDMAALIQRVQTVTTDIQDLRQQLRATREHAQAILEQARQVSLDTAWAHLRETPAPTALPSEEGPPVTPQPDQPSLDLDTREAARLIGAILRHLPLEQQVIIVKALAS